MRHELSIAVSDVDRCRLEALVANGNPSRRQTRRAEVVLLSVGGISVREIALRTGRSKIFVLKWRERFMQFGFEGLLRNKRRSDWIVPIKAEISQRGQALMLVGSTVGAPPWNPSARNAVLTELMRIDGQLTELSKRLDLLEDRSSVRQSGFCGRMNSSLMVPPTLFSEDEDNSFAAHVAFGMSKSRMNS